MTYVYFALAAFPSSFADAFGVVWMTGALSFVLGLSVVFGIICNMSPFAPLLLLPCETEFACAGRIPPRWYIVLGKHGNRTVISRMIELYIH